MTAVPLPYVFSMFVASINVGIMRSYLLSYDSAIYRTFFNHIWYYIIAYLYQLVDFFIRLIHIYFLDWLLGGIK